MRLFGKKEGGIMDVIRCDEKEYLVWKWRPSGDANSTKKENAIRYGSSLRVKDGELAVFVYQQNDGNIQDFIVGPHDQMIESANFPVLTNLVGTAFGGASPFQAEIYFINLAGNIQIKFGVPYFDVFDPRFTDFAVPIAARGTITFNLTDYKGFIKLNRLINFDLEDFNQQIKDAINKYIKSVITNIPVEKNIPVLHLERKLLEINDIIASYLKTKLYADFGVNLKSLDLSAIEVNKDSIGYAELRKVTAEQTTKTTVAQTDINIKNLDETLRIQREEAQRIQKLQTETNFIGTHALNQQTEILKTGAQSLGNMGNVGGDGGGMNPAGIMTGLMMGGAMGNQMANMMNQMSQNINQPQNTPPLPPQINYNIAVNGQSFGPYNWQQIQEMVKNNQISMNTHMWTKGMSNWELAGNIPDIAVLFNETTPPPPPPPPSTV